MEAHATQRNPAKRAKRGRDSHARVFERSGRIHPLMFGKQARHARDPRTLRQFIQWSVAFAQGDGLFVTVERG